MAMLSMPNVISFRAQITMVVLLSAITFAYGFISAFQAGQKQASCEGSYMNPAEKLDNSEVGSLYREFSVGSLYRDSTNREFSVGSLYRDSTNREL